MLPYLYCGGSVEAGLMEQFLKGALATDHTAMLWWGITMCRSGNKQGLRVLLICAKLFEDVQKDALSRFENSVGLDAYTANTLKASPERLAADLTWFDSIEKQIVWDTDAKKFKAPEGVQPSDIREYQQKAVKPPAPPPKTEQF